MDASLIDLSLALCPWANLTSTDAAVKLHLLLELRSPLPAFVAILDQMPIDPGSFYAMDRGYIDLRRFAYLATAGAPLFVLER